MVVGAAGAIGQALCAALADAGEEVVACIRETPLPPALAARVTVRPPRSLAGLQSTTRSLSLSSLILVLCLPSDLIRIRLFSSLIVVL